MPTIGVAIALPEPWASDLQEYRTALGDETATLIPTHITLVPPRGAVRGPDRQRGVPPGRGLRRERAVPDTPPWNRHLPAGLAGRVLSLIRISEPTRTK